MLKYHLFGKELILRLAFYSIYFNGIKPLTHFKELYSYLSIDIDCSFTIGEYLQ